MVAHQRSQAFARRRSGGQLLQRLLLAGHGTLQALFHDGMQQRVLALEMVEGRTAAHVGGSGYVAGAGGVKTLRAEQPRRTVDDELAAVAVIAGIGGLARPPPGPRCRHGGGLPGQRRGWFGTGWAHARDDSRERLLKQSFA